MNSTEVQNPQCKLDDVFILAYVFGSVLACAMHEVCSRVSEDLLLIFRILSLFLTNNSSSDSKAFLRFIVFSVSPTAVCRAFLFFDAKVWPQSQTATCTTILHCGHTFLRSIDLLHSVPCTTVLHCGHTFLNLS